MSAGSRSEASRRLLGQQAEDLVCKHLASGGFTIVDRNVRVGMLELDIIARRGSLLAFCEVRSRSSDAWMTPAQSVDAAKVRRLRRAAAQWLDRTRPGPVDVRFDVASVVFDVPGGRLNYLEGAF